MERTKATTALGEFIIAHPGATVTDMRKEFGWNPNQTQQQLLKLTYFGDLYEEEASMKTKYFMSQWFEKPVFEVDDILYAITGYSTEDYAAEIRREFSPVRKEVLLT